MFSRVLWKGFDYHYRYASVRIVCLRFGRVGTWCAGKKQLKIVKTLQLIIFIKAHPHDGYYRHHAIAPRFDVVQSLSEIIDQIADSYMTTATDLEGQVVEVFDPIIPELTKTLDDGNNELAVISDEFDVDFKNSEIGACIDELRESVRAILSNGKEEVAQCVQATRDQASELRAALEIRVAFIKEQVSAIRNIVSGCKASDEPVKCILQNVIIFNVYFFIFF